MSDRIPRAPKGLKSAGKALWRSVAADFDLDEWECGLLKEAARVADRLDAIADAAAAAPLTVRNHRGDEVANPLLVEARQQAIVLSRLLASLRLPSGEEEADLARPQRRGAARGAYGGIRSVS